MKVGIDIVGNVAVVKFSRDARVVSKKRFAKKLLKENKSVKTILEKTQKFKGRLRKMQTKHLAGEKTKEVLYRENGCVFRFNIDKTYFSPRLSNERKEIAGLIKKNEEVLVMFAGVAPYSIVIAKLSKASRIYSNEINREANKYAKLNVELNKLKDKVILLNGDIKRIAEQLTICPTQSPNHPPKIINAKKDSRLAVSKNRAKRGNIPNKFDIIVMPRPQLKETFLKQAFMLSKKGTRIFYYDFCKQDEIDLIINKIKTEAKKCKVKIKILKTKTAGEIAPYKIRLRVDFRVL